MTIEDTLATSVVRALIEHAQDLIEEKGVFGAIQEMAGLGLTPDTPETQASERVAPRAITDRWREAGTIKKGNPPRLPTQLELMHLLELRREELRSVEFRLRSDVQASLEEEFARYYEMGLRHSVPGNWAHLVVQVFGEDSDYEQFLRLKQRYEPEGSPWAT